MFSPRKSSISWLLACSSLACLAACGDGAGGGSGEMTETMREEDAAAQGGQDTEPSSDLPGQNDADAGDEALVESDAGNVIQDGAVTSGPSVVTTIPKTGSTGVRGDAVLVFQFSERMDPNATEAAYTSSELPPESVNFVWNDAGDTLTIVPKDDLPYAAGDEAVVALSFELTITDSAKNFAGEPLNQEAALSFTTLRRITHAAPRVASLTGRVNGDGVATSSVLLAGDTAANVPATGFMTFTLEGVPTDVELERARISVNETGVTGAPDSKLGQLTAQHVSFDALNESAFNAKSSGSVSVLQPKVVLGSPQRRTAEVTAWVRGDLDNRVALKDRSQSRFRYLTASNNDNMADYVSLDRSSTQLEIVYLAP